MMKNKLEAIQQELLSYTIGAVFKYRRIFHLSEVDISNASFNEW